MKFILTLSTAIFLPHGAFASFQEAYSTKASSHYNKALEGAKKLQLSVDTFLTTTSQENLEAAQSVWTEVRKDYSVTEIYRFYGGPIDGEEGPEGLINAWPLDEAYIDYVNGKSNSGIINDTVNYPVIDKELLIELNEKDGEKNISTGWHAIEFILWGQDFNDEGPGSRPLSDFLVGAGKNAERRRAYLKVATDLLVEHLQTVADAWEVNQQDSYFNTFVALDEMDALQKAFTSLVSMSSDELAIERMFVAYDTQFQEDEHSCFSDTTHFDLLFNFMGVKNLWEVVNNNKKVSPTLVKNIGDRLALLENELTHFKGPFDNAIFDKEGREQIKLIVNELQLLGEDFKTAGGEWGVAL